MSVFFFSFIMPSSSCYSYLVYIEYQFLKLGIEEITVLSFAGDNFLAESANTVIYVAHRKRNAETLL